MKTTFAAALLFLSGLALASAQGTAFTYQGRLTDGGSPASGLYDLRSILYDADVGGSQVGAILMNASVAVANGLFAVTLDFGASFPGADRWLEMGVRTNGSGPFTTLSPRQKLTPTPYAITAASLSGTLPAAQLTGTVPAGTLAGAYAGAVAFNNPANSFSGNGAGLTDLSATQLTGTVPDARLSANVALLNAPNQVFTGRMGFGAAKRQMLDLYSSGNLDYGIGVQAGTFYQRAGSGGSFAWYGGGVHSDAQNDPGAGGTSLMTLDALGNLKANSVSGNGAGLTNLSTTQLTGTVPDARLSANVALLNAPNQVFTGLMGFGAATRQMLDL